MNIGALEVTLILVLALLLFGAKKLPELAKSLGKAMKEFKNGVQGVSEEETEIPEKKPPQKTRRTRKK